MTPTTEQARDWFFAAQDEAQRSDDPSTKVGAIIMRPQPTLGNGLHWTCEAKAHNDLVRGTSNPEHVWQNRTMKYRCVVHAEAEAILQAGDRSIGATIAVSAHPCCDCAKLIVGAGIVCVVCPEKPWRYDNDVIDSLYWARRILDGAKVKRVHL